MSRLEQNRVTNGDGWSFTLASLNLLRTIDVRRWVADEIGRIVEEGPRLDRTYDASFSHPNGFDLLVLDQSQAMLNGQPAFKVRLHVWGGGSRGAVRGDIHNHAWDFSSFVLCGSLSFETFAAEIPPDEADATHVKLWYDGTTECTTEVGKILVSPGITTTFGRGASYAFDHRTFHRAGPEPDALCMTLVVTGPYVRRGSEVILPRFEPDRAQEDFLGIKIGLEAFRDRLVHLRSQLDDGHV